MYLPADPEEAIHLARASGVKARVDGRPRDDCTFNPDHHLLLYLAWHEGWDDDPRP